MQSPFALIFAATFLLVFGCGKKAIEAPLAVEQVPQVMETAFKEAKPEVTTVATEIVSAVRKEDPSALLDLQDLSARPDLTAEQQNAAYRATFALLKRTREAAARGDKNAEKVLEHYRATK